MAKYTVTVTVDLDEDAWEITKYPEKVGGKLEDWLQIMSDTTETGIGRVRVADIRRQKA